MPLDGLPAGNVVIFDSNIGLFAYPQNSSIPDENWLDSFSPDMFEISVGAHSCAMNSRLKAAPTITLSERKTDFHALWCPEGG
jgi:hypothetical protein